MGRRKKKYLLCDLPEPEKISAEDQLAITSIGAQIVKDIMEGGIPGIIIYKVPDENGCNKIYSHFFDGIQDALRAAARARVKDIMELKRLMKRFRVESKKG